MRSVIAVAISGGTPSHVFFAACSASSHACRSSLRRRTQEILSTDTPCPVRRMSQPACMLVDGRTKYTAIMCTPPHTEASAYLKACEGFPTMKPHIVSAFMRRVLLPAST